MKKLIVIFIIAILSFGAGFLAYSKLKGKGDWKVKSPLPAEEVREDNQENIESTTEATEETLPEENKANPENVKEEKKSEEGSENIENKAETKESDKSSSGIISKSVSWGYQSASSRNIDTIIIHSSYNALGGDKYSVDGLLKEYKEYGVSPHYLIDREGKIYQLVADKNVAYHAGVSQVPDGRTNVNNFSIGIELMNTEDSQFTAQQYASLKNLIAQLKGKYKIKYVLGHNQIASGRKTDPWNFDWKKDIN